MEIYERIFSRLEEMHMSQSELSKMTGIPTSTISDWRKKKINPQADKLVSICKALNISLVDLLCNEEERDELETDYLIDEKHLMEIINHSDKDLLRKIISYIESSLIILDAEEVTDKRNVSVIQDADGKNIVVINDICFKGKQNIDWKAVKEYLRNYIGDIYIIAATGDEVYVGSDLPGEYTGSKYTKKLKGGNAKAKANASSGLPELVEIAVEKHFRENKELKHKRDAKNGWYRYDSRFALPVYNTHGEIERYNVYHASILIRHAYDGKMYLYDIIDIKKETSNPLGS